jgi:serine/threonine protein kinase
VIGTKLGSYEITAQIGEGGMGLVYKAKDFQLGREVALKVLPEGFSQDAERLARFEREAKLLASLNHPNIAQIYGLETSGGSPALVMELVEGPTLADRLAGGGLSIDESLSIARQIAEALEEAHEKGIIHRDLKPQNVKASIEGKVKVLDFGLAKAMEPIGAASSSSSRADVARSPTLMNSPTLTAAHGTQLGVILGTAAYMSPEQARGGSVDKRADVWAFGVVLWEMLSGRTLFAADTVPDTLARVLTREPDLSALPARVPPAIRRLLRRCLERNPKNRLHDIADARIVIDEALAGRSDEAVAVAAPAPRGRLLPWLVAGALAVALTAAIVTRPPPPRAAPSKSVEISLPPGYLLNPEAPLALAPDGSAIVFSASDSTHVSQLFLRRLDRFEVSPLEGTDEATFPFWSPDSKSIAFYRADSLRRYDLATRSTQVILKTGALPRAGAWMADGTILLTPSANAPIQRVPATGGTPQDVTQLDPAVLDGSHRFPVLLPDGKRFLFTFWTNNLEAAARVGGIYVASIDGGPIRRLTPDMSQAVLAGGDRLLVYRDGALVSLRFDPTTASVEGGGEEISEAPLRSASSGALAVSASAAGDLAFSVSSGEGSGELAWIDRKGASEGEIGIERLSFARVALAPDDRHFAAEVAGSTGGDIWVGDVERKVASRLTRGTVDHQFPVWSPDGSRVAFTDEITGMQSVYVQPADGSRAEDLLVADPERDLAPSSWAASGKLLVLDEREKSTRREEIWVYDFGARSARVLLADPTASLSRGTLSPDGRWLAYVSDESGNPEVFVRPYPALDRKWKLSQGGATEPHWRRDGREVVFVATSDRSLQAVPVEPGPDGLTIGTQELLFRPTSPLLAITPTSDHRRFLAGVVPSDVRSEPIRVILGWRASQEGEPR